MSACPTVWTFIVRLSPEGGEKIRCHGHNRYARNWRLTARAGVLRLGHKKVTYITMEGITKEYFDEQMSTLVAKIDGLDRIFDERLTAQTGELKAYTNARFEELAGMVQRGFADLSEQLDMREQVEQHERDIQHIKQALNLA